MFMRAADGDNSVCLCTVLHVAMFSWHSCAAPALQVTVNDIDLRYAKGDRTRLAATVSWIQVDNMLPTVANSNAVVLAPTAVKTPQPTLQISILAEPTDPESRLLAHNLSNVVALLQVETHVLLPPYQTPLLCVGARAVQHARGQFFLYACAMMSWSVCLFSGSMVRLNSSTRTQRRTHSRGGGAFSADDARHQTFF